MAGRGSHELLSVWNELHPGECSMCAIRRFLPRSNSYTGVFVLLVSSCENSCAVPTLKSTCQSRSTKRPLATKAASARSVVSQVTSLHSKGLSSFDSSLVDILQTAFTVEFLYHTTVTTFGNIAAFEQPNWHWEWNTSAFFDGLMGALVQVCRLHRSPIASQ